MSIKNEIKELEDKIEELKEFSKDKNIDFSLQIDELEKQLEKVAHGLPKLAAQKTISCK